MSPVNELHRDIETKLFLINKMSLSDHEGGLSLQEQRTSRKLRLWGKDAFYGNGLHATHCSSATKQLLL